MVFTFLLWEKEESWVIAMKDMRKMTTSPEVFLSPYLFLSSLVFYLPFPLPLFLTIHPSLSPPPSPSPPTLPPSAGIRLRRRGPQHWCHWANRPGHCGVLGYGPSRCGHPDGHLYQELRLLWGLHSRQSCE